MTTDRRRHAPATTRNREPILEVLRDIVPRGANVLEIASGSGEHAVFLAPRLSVASWQPTDPDPAARASIDVWRLEAGSPHVLLPPITLDTTEPVWPSLPVRPDVIMCANMIHIAPWSACEGLIRGAASALGAGGTLYLYGPYKQGGRHSAPSNESFDESLRARDPQWGVRDLDDVTRVASAHGFELVRVVPMPANNLSVIFVRT